MDSSSLKKSKLESEVLRHKKLYYLGNPEISDEEYDALEEELKELDPESYVFSIIGSEEISEQKVKHESKMLSLNKVYSLDELEKWREKKDVVSTFKIDGSSCSLVYKNGILVQAKTRGNGSVGENVLEKALFIETIPKKLNVNVDIEVRGEVFCIEKSFKKIERFFKTNDLEKPSSKRNVVAGILGRKNFVEAAQFLNFQAFELIGVTLNNELEKFKYLEKASFVTPQYRVCSSESEVEEEILKSQRFQSEGDYLIDGLVLTFNDIKVHYELGSTAHHPKYKMAFKFQGETRQTIIESIVWQVSRNGVLTPVANVKPVELSGAIVSRVTLHNFSQVVSRDLKKGDLIEIVRSGEVIPKYLKTIKSSKESISIPTHCPSCAQKVTEVEIRLICQNKKCPAQMINEIIHYIKKVGIEDLSEKRVAQFIEAGLVHSISDLYQIKEGDVLKLESFQEKLTHKIISSINKSKEIGVIKFLSAIGILGVSEVKLEKIINERYDTLEKIQDLSLENLQSIDGFAQKSSQIFIDSLKEKKGLIDSLIKAGVNIKKAQLVKAGDSFQGMSFCITGSLSRPRKEIEVFIKSNGGNISSSVTKKLDYLVTNDEESTSSKFQKAQKLEIPIVSEAQLERML